MNKAVVIIVSVMIFLSSFIVIKDTKSNVHAEIISLNSYFSGGSGSPEDPYLISDIWEFQNISLDMDGFYILTNDIDASDTVNWNSGGGFIPIGDWPESFNGTLDGRGHKITDLHINRNTTDMVALLSSIGEPGIVRNLGIENANIIGYLGVGILASGVFGLVENCYTTGEVLSYNYTGGFVSGNTGIIQNCWSNATIYNGYWAGGFACMNGGLIQNCNSSGYVWSVTNTGGFVGSNTGRIQNCYSDIFTKGLEYTGGFIGCNWWGIVKNCFSTGYTEAGTRGGGFIGFDWDSQVINCYSAGEIIGGTEIGGFVGYAWDSDISYCYSNTKVGNSLNGARIGGFIGKLNGEISNCYSTGDVMASTYAGGFAGNMEYTSTISDCYSTGNVTGNWDYIGGFIGSSKNYITNCYSTGNVSGAYNLGGFSGSNYEGEISKCYSTGNVSGNSTLGGFVGANYGLVNSCFSLGNVKGDFHIGGFAGRNYDDSIILQSYSTGNVLASGYVVGGFIGLNDNVIQDCYSWGNVTGDDSVGGFVGKNSLTTSINRSYSIGNVTGNIKVGGFCGYNYSGLIENCYWDYEASGNIISDGGVGLSTFQMQQPAFFDEWPDSIWEKSTLDYQKIRTCSLLTIPLIHHAPMIYTPELMKIGVATEDMPYASYLEANLDPQRQTASVQYWTISSNSLNWLTINSTSGQLTGIPSNVDVGTNEVIIDVYDDLGEMGKIRFNITVINVEPVILGNDFLTAIGETLYINDYASSDDPNALWNLSTNADWLSLNSTTGLLIGTPTNAQSGTYWVNVSLEDGNGGTDYHNFTLDVQVDTDHDSEPDITDVDDDNDGILDVDDIFPLDPLEDTDTDGDGIGDNADTDDDNDGWNDTVEIVGGFDQLDNTSMPNDTDMDGLADFMDPDFLGFETIVNNTEYNNNTVNVTTDPVIISETPTWAWGAVIAAVVMGIFATLGSIRGRKPEAFEENDEPNEIQ